MRSFERTKGRESLDASLARIAYAYGFSSQPIAIPQTALKKYDTGDETAVSVATLKAAGKGKGPRHIWSSSKGAKQTTLLTFAIVSDKSAIAHTLVIKTVLGIAEAAGYSDLSVSVSSVGDQESRKRFTRELGNFFKKNAAEVPADLKHAAQHDPEKAYRALLKSGDLLAKRTPKPIDYLSENSRKTMLDTISLFEAVGIQYAIEPRLMSEEGVHSELLFAIDGTTKRGERVRIALGGRFDELLKKEGVLTEPAVSVSMRIPERLDAEGFDDRPHCFVVHVGEAAKLKMFSVLDAVTKADLAIGQAIMAETFKDQMERASTSGSRLIAIIGQREALDSTIIVRSVSTQLQQTIPLERLIGHLSRYGR